ncbi:MAG: hypothetical protein ACI4XS_10550 [Bacillus sp. (in: firmicutes)]
MPKKHISLHYHETEKIATLSRETGKSAIVGFNRRFTPHVAELKQCGKADLIIIQKNDLPFQTL